MAWKDWQVLFIYLASVLKQKPKEVAGRRDTYVLFDIGSNLLIVLKTYATVHSGLSKQSLYTFAVLQKKEIHKDPILR